jgi:hypothetical protein
MCLFTSTTEPFVSSSAKRLFIIYLFYLLLIIILIHFINFNIRYALNYVHALELLGNLGVAWDALLSHLVANPQLSIGGVTNADFLAAAADGRSDSEWNIGWLKKGEPYAVCSTSSYTPRDIRYPTLASSLFFMFCMCENQTLFFFCSSYMMFQSAPEVLDDPRLDGLALWFCAVKIRYLMGKSVVSLIACVEPARRCSKHPLHSTTIRNEHAYYCCIAQLKAASCTANATDMSRDSELIYVCGDSHCLSPAWQRVVSTNKTLLLEPKLVTGLKHWHLRPEGDFYPKV